MSAIQPVVKISFEVFGCLDKLSSNAGKKTAKFIEKFCANPHSSGINYERINNVKDSNLRSVRIDQGIRGIVLSPEKGNVFVLLWIDKHDDAYKWAENKLARVNSASGAVQVFAVEEQSVSAETKTSEPVPGIFDGLKDRQLARLSVPKELFSVARGIASEEELEKAKDRFPKQAYDGLFLMEAGYSYEDALRELDRKDEDSGISSDDFEAAFETDESKSEFWVPENEKELRGMLDAPLEKWRVFLHPLQRKLIEGDYSGPVRVLGGAGTGKTVVAMHRARWLAENRLKKPSDRILFTTYTTNLALDIQKDLGSICSKEQLEQIEVTNLDAWVRKFLKENGVSHSIVFPGDSKLNGLWADAISDFGSDLGLERNFYKDEWSAVIQANCVLSKEEYINEPPRAGRSTGLDKKLKAKVWKVFEAYKTRKDKEGILEPDDAFRLAREIIVSEGHKLPYKFVVVDEAQDLGPEAFRLIRALVPVYEAQPDTNSLFIVGDGHQRIYGRRVILSRCGIDTSVRKLRINYRTTEEIRKWASSMHEGVDVDDLDDGKDEEKGFRSVLHGLVPEVKKTKDQAEELQVLLDWLLKLKEANIASKDICILARKNSTLEAVKGFLDHKGLDCVMFQRSKADDRSKKGIRLATMHRAKGYEFMAVALFSMNDGIVPNEKAIEAAPDEAGRKEAMDMERMLVYVAATRAKKHLLVTSSGKASQFIE